MKWWLLLALILFESAFGQKLQLGDISFANSGKPAAQEAFLNGVAALHAFWYPEAAFQFQEAQRLDPDFALAYWGEAMTYNHPIWHQQDLQKARATLNKLAATPEQRLAKAKTEKEKIWLESVEILYGPGSKLERDVKYNTYLKRMYGNYPDDLEATTFYALSILGTILPGETDFSKQMQAATVLVRASDNFPADILENHPGMAHYMLHSFDDPLHAGLALATAYRIGQFAPDSSHLLHMGSHIFVQLGKWDDAASYNKRSYATSVEWADHRHLGLIARDYHALYWQ